ncbi:hypothetical protein GDO86_001672 [Hymenochirus boettgeri]|uniref:Secreted protein n=1 Tax=Hymenochirus boettgeri TaxID=247094 RepID=A0A8T2KMG8_9PIPI|nr:hypothetical protein GDO86_001672 [Hymenochirus boettgeri]
MNSCWGYFILFVKFALQHSCDAAQTAQPDHFVANLTAITSITKHFPARENSKVKIFAVDTRSLSAKSTVMSVYGHLQRRIAGIM